MKNCSQGAKQALQEGMIEQGALGVDQASQEGMVKEGSLEAAFFLSFSLCFFTIQRLLVTRPHLWCTEWC